MTMRAARPSGALLAWLTPGQEAWRRLDVGLRVVLAVAGGYGLAALCTMLLSVTLPLPRVEAVLAASMLSFAVYAGAVVWAFAARSVLRACAGMAILAVPLGIALLLRGTGA
jgi:hypothetical protein